MPKVRSVPVAQVRELLTSAFAACEVNTGATTPAEYAASVVSQLKPVVRPPKTAPLESVWLVFWSYSGCVWAAQKIIVTKETPTRLRVDRWHNNWFHKGDEGRQWFRDERAALVHCLAASRERAERDRIDAEEGECGAWLLEQALAELVPL